LLCRRCSSAWPRTTFIPLFIPCRHNRFGGCPWWIDYTGALEGILSLDDVVLYAGDKAADDLSNADVVDTMRSICEHASPAKVLAVTHR
jgi:hypothetical protein